MFCIPVDLPVIESTAIHLPDDFLAQHGMDNCSLTDENINYLAQWALDHFRPDLIGMGMDWNLEEKLDQIFRELKALIPTYQQNKFKWHIQKNRASYWQAGQSFLTWNVIVNNHLAVSFIT